MHHSHICTPTLNSKDALSMKTYNYYEFKTYFFKLAKLTFL